MVAKFNASGQEVAGKRVFVSMKAMNSGDAESAIARGRLQPDVWSPAGSFWGRLLNLRADKPYVAQDNPSIVRTPLVIAMWEPMAQALGYPRKAVAFEDIVRLATDPRGWAAAGKPAFGRFKYVHTNPDSSTSGAEAVTGSYYALAGKKEGLTDADVAKAAPRVKDLERSIVHYGDSTLFIEDQLCKGGLAYASAVAMEETTVIDFNRRSAARTPSSSRCTRTEGSFFSDSPYIVLNADWVTPAERQAAAAFQKFLAGEVDADLAGALRLPPRRSAGQAGGPRDRGQRRRPDQAAARADAARAAGAQQGPHHLAARPQAGPRDARPRQLGLDAGRGQARARQGRAARLLPAGRSAGRDRADEVLREGDPAGDARALRAQQRGARRRRSRTSSPRTTPRSTTPRCRRSTRSRRGPTPSTSTRWWCSPTARTPRPRSPAGRSSTRLGQEGKAESNAVRVFTIAYGSDAKASELDRLRGGLRRQGLQGLHRRHRAGLPLDLLLLLDARSELVTRGALERRLAVNAATKPLNILVPGGVIVVGDAAEPDRGGAADRDRRLHRAVACRPSSTPRRRRRSARRTPTAPRRLSASRARRRHALAAHRRGRRRRRARPPPHPRRVLEADAPLRRRRRRRRRAASPRWRPRPSAPS